MKKYWTGKIVLCIAVILLACVAAQAQDPIPLPTVPPHAKPPFVYHLDPPFLPFGSPAPDWTIAAGVGPAGKIVLGFTDALHDKAKPWHWETEWRNPGGAQIVLPIIFRGPDKTTFPKAGKLTIPGLGFAIKEFIFHEAPEVGGWVYSMTPMVGNPLFEHDASVCEGQQHEVVEPPEWQAYPVLAIDTIDHIEVVFTHPVPAHTPWGLIVLVGLVIISGLWLWSKRRVKLAR